MISAKSLTLLIFTSLFIDGSTQYYGYPGYGYNYRPYPVSTQNYYRQSPCRSSCNSCQYVPCYGSYGSYVQQQPQQPYYLPYAYYNSRQYASPYINYFQSPKRTSDPFANVPVEIIDDDTVPRQARKNRYFDEYANVPTEIIDDDSPGDFWKKIPLLPKARTSSHSNYSVSHGSVTSNNVSENKPVRASVTRIFQPQKQNPEYSRIDFFNGVAANNTESQRKAEVAEESGEELTTVAEELEVAETTTETNEVPEKESEEVSAVRGWLL